MHPDKCLSQAARVPFNALPCPALMPDPDLIETQYRRILLHIWKEEEIFGGELPKDTAQFWAKILHYKHSDGQRPYKELAQYALDALSVPVSNAIVERVFSHVTYVKNKNSNSLSIKMLDAILRVRLTLKLKGKCCTDLEITPKMLELFTKAMYVNEEELEDLSSFI